MNLKKGTLSRNLIKNLKATNKASLRNGDRFHNSK